MNREPAPDQPSPTPRVRPKDRKEHIARAAAELFAERGFDAATIDEIGERVGISGPALYRHFASKEALLEAIAQQSANLLQAMETTDSAKGRSAFQAITTATVRTVLNNGALFGVVSREQHHLSRAVRRHIREAERHLFKTWRAALRSEKPELSDTQIALRLRAGFGALSAPATYRSPVDRTRLAELLIDSIAALLMSEPPPTLLNSAIAPIPRWATPPSRREQILAAALTRFRERDFHSVSISEIAESVGLSASGIYRHFESKIDILVEAYDRASARVWVGTRDALQAASSAREALTRLTRAYVAVAVDSIDLIAATSRGTRLLPPEQRPRLARQRAATLEGWIGTLCACRPELTSSEAETLVRMGMGLANQAVQLYQPPAQLEQELATLFLAFLSPPLRPQD